VPESWLRAPAVLRHNRESSYAEIGRQVEGSRLRPRSPGARRRLCVRARQLNSHHKRANETSVFACYRRRLRRALRASQAECVSAASKCALSEPVGRGRRSLASGRVWQKCRPAGIDIAVAMSLQQESNDFVGSDNRASRWQRSTLPDVAPAPQRSKIVRDTLTRPRLRRFADHSIIRVGATVFCRVVIGIIAVCALVLAFDFSPVSKAQAQTAPSSSERSLTSTQSRLLSQDSPFGGSNGSGFRIDWDRLKSFTATPQANRFDKSKDHLHLGDSYIELQTEKSLQTFEPLRRADCAPEDECADYPGLPTAERPRKSIKHFRKPFIGLSITRPLQ
jgi:hypothetical protein